MMGLIVNARQSYSEQRGLLEHTVNKNKAVKQQLALAKRRTDELENIKGKAAVAKLDADKGRDAAETALARKNPATAVVAKQQAAEMFDEVEKLMQQQVDAARAAEDAEADAAAVEAEATALEETVKAAEADAASLRRDVQRLKDVLVDVVTRSRGGAGGAAPPNLPVGQVGQAPPQQTANDVWSHIQRAQQQRQGQNAARQPQLAGYVPVPAAQAYPPQSPVGHQQSPININIGGGGGGMAQGAPPGAYFVQGGGQPPQAPPGYAAVPVYSPGGYAQHG